MTAYRTASAAWLAIAERAEASRAGCCRVDGSVSGLCGQLGRLLLAGAVDWRLETQMTIQLRQVFMADGAGYPYYWPRTTAGWHTRVIAATLLHCLSLDEEEGR